MMIMKHCLKPSLLAVIAAAMIWLSPAASAQDSKSGPKLTTVYRTHYIPKFPQKRAMNGRFRDRLVALQEKALAKNRAGQDTPCTSQLLKEARWLMNYTQRIDDMEAMLAELKDSLAVEDQSFTLRQAPTDGSWGVCHKEWFFRLHTSVDPIKELINVGKVPERALGFLEPVNTPLKLRAVMEGLLISDMETEGVNHRKELNLVVTGLGQLLFLPKLAHIYPADFPRQELAQELIDFMDNRWQDKETGYWGAWYKVDGEIKKANDLSITFHVVSYRQDDPPRMDEMADTLFSTRTLKYPYGWRDRGRQNNHHAYDVVRLLRRSWPYLDLNQQARGSAQLVLMLARSLGLSIDHQGHMVDTAYESVSEAYYFGVSFLDEIGYFRDSQRFWSALQMDGAEQIRDRLEQHLVALNSETPMAVAALRKLRLRD